MFAALLTALANALTVFYTMIPGLQQIIEIIGQWLGLIFV